MEEPLVLSKSQQELVDLIVTIFVEQIFQNDGERAGIEMGESRTMRNNIGLI